MWPFRSSSSTVELENVRNSYDYIIVGAGSAGCVLANRLSEDSSISVLVLERGGPASGWSSRVPLLSSDYNSDGSRSKRFPSVPQSALDNQPTEIICGSALGGSSKINGMIYTRGLAGQFADWTLQGRKGWSYDELYPYFLKSEGIDKTTKEEFHNYEGEWKVRSTLEYTFATAHNMIRAAKALNFPYISDLNSPNEPIYGIGKLDRHIDKNGRRCDTASAFLPIPLLESRRNRLHVCVNALVTELELETAGESLVAKGVVVERTDKTKSGQTYKIFATKEVVLCAGTIGTPQILMLSGIGPRQHLSDIGVDVKKHLPGVGSNLQDHMGIITHFHVPLKDSLTSLQKSPLLAIRELLKYLMFGTGMFLCPVHELSLFANTEFLSESSENLVEDPMTVDRADPKYLPDIELMTIAFGETEKNDKANGGYTLWTVPVRPFSRGTVRLKSRDPRENPVVDPNLLNDPRDRMAAHKGLKLCLKLKENLVANGYEIKDYKVPTDTSPGGLDKHIVEHGRSIYHYTSSCRMAPEDDILPGVVDDELRVHGVKCLRIVDGSILPDILATHLQATIVAIAEKISDMLKGDK